MRSKDNNNTAIKINTPPKASSKATPKSDRTAELSSEEFRAKLAKLLPFEWQKQADWAEDEKSSAADQYNPSDKAV